MSCDRIRDRLELASLGGVTAGESAELEAHLAVCPACREAWEECREAAAAVRASIAPAHPRPAFHRALREAVRSEIRRARRFGTGRRIAAASAAALLLAAAAVWRSADRPGAAPALRLADIERWRLAGAATGRAAPSGALAGASSRAYFVRRDGAGRRVVAVDVATGRTCWETPVDANGPLAADASRVYCPVADDRRAAGLAALDAERGTLLWRYAGAAAPAFCRSARPVPWGDRVCWSAGDTVHMIDAGTGRRIWAHAVDGRGRLSAAEILGGRLYVADAATLTCLDGADGRVCWSQRLGGDDAEPLERPLLAAAGGRAYVVSPLPRRSGRLACADLADGRLRWTRLVPWPHHVAASDEAVYVRAGEVTAYDRDRGTMRWSRAAEGCGPLTPDGRFVHFVDASGGGRLLALERGSGRAVRAIEGVRSCEPVLLAGGLGVVETVDGIVHAVPVWTP